MMPKSSNVLCVFSAMALRSMLNPCPHFIRMTVVSPMNVVYEQRASAPPKLPSVYAA